MAGKILDYRKHGRKGSGFQNNFAFIIGIDEYRNEIQSLRSAVNDANRLGELLKEKHDYTVRLITQDVTLKCLTDLFFKELLETVGENDRVLIYFAGHGVALDGELGPEGYLIPADANPQDESSLLSMEEVNKALEQLQCRHLLVILDCCFAGTFRWAGTRDVLMFPDTIYREQYERFIREPAWQVITSTAYDQKALDVVAGQAIGRRVSPKIGATLHSPFALALFDALEGAADVVPRDGGDGLITATELYLFLREQVEKGVAAYHNQTPGLWPLRREYDKGEYVFISPHSQLRLKLAPDLTDENNPYRGLESYDFIEEHSNLFFGRDDEISTLKEKVIKNPFTAVLGASGTGKSSLVKAGLLPDLARQAEDQADLWHILTPMRPGNTPMLNLMTLLVTESPTRFLRPDLATFQTEQDTLSRWLTAWKAIAPKIKLVLTIDQLEELVTLCREEERTRFLSLLAHTIRAHPDHFRLIVTIRTDFEPHFNVETPLESDWSMSRYVVPPMDQADLRQVIEGPIAVRVLYFETEALVDTLINEVIQTPGALPLLSFTLSEMYIQYLKSGRNDRALTKKDKFNYAPQVLYPLKAMI